MEDDPLARCRAARLQAPNAHLPSQAITVPMTTGHTTEEPDDVKASRPVLSAGGGEGDFPRLANMMLDNFWALAQFW